MNPKRFLELLNAWEKGMRGGFGKNLFRFLE